MPAASAGRWSRLRPHLSKLAGGRASGTARAPGPLPARPHPGRSGEGAGGRAGSALDLPPNSFSKAALRSLTQKRGLSRGSARVLAWRVAIRGFHPPRGPAGPPRPTAPKAPLAMCRLFWVPQQGGAGEREARPRPEAGGRGQGWSGVGRGGGSADPPPSPAARTARRGPGSGCCLLPLRAGRG